MLHKKCAALLAAATALAMLAGCGAVEPRVDPSSSSSVASSSASSSSSSATGDRADRRLRFPCNLSDSFNPYTCETATNLHLMSLLYQPLVRLGADYSVENVLAADVRLDGLVCTVTIDPSARFTNGDALTAADVAASCRAAMESPHYADALTNIENVETDGDDTLRLTLREADAFFVNLLTFPIVRAGTQADALPLGTGRYLLRDLESGAPVLAANNVYYADAQPAYRNIELVDNPDTREQVYDLRLGNLDLVAEDVTDKEVLNIGTAAYYDTNALVYLGFQCGGGVTRDVAFRTALAGALDSASVLAEAYGGSGTATHTLLNPNAFPDLTSSIARDAAPLTAYLSAAGYEITDAEGYRVNAEGQRLSLKLLVNSDNPARYAAAQALVQQCKAVGVEVVLTAEPFGTYVTMLQNGAYDLYLAEVRLPLNFDLTALLSPASGTAFGFAEDEELLYTHALFRTGEATAQQLVDQFETQLPFLPLFYHASSVIYTRALLHVAPLQQDLFYNLEEWRFAE